MSKRQLFFTLDGSSRQNVEQHWVMFLKPHGVKIRDVSSDQLGHPPVHDIARIFRAVDEYALDNRFVGGFPTFIRSGGPDYRPNQKVVLLTEMVAGRRDVPVGELGNPSLNHHADLFRLTYDYAWSRSRQVAFPTFQRTDAFGQVTLSMVLIKPNMAYDLKVPSAALGTQHPNDVEAAFRGANEYAHANGWAAAFPTFHGEFGEYSQLHSNFNGSSQIRHLVENEGWQVARVDPLGAQADSSGDVHFATVIVLEKNDLQQTATVRTSAAADSGVAAPDPKPVKKAASRARQEKAEQEFVEIELPSVRGKEAQSDRTDEADDKEGEEGTDLYLPPLPRPTVKGVVVNEVGLPVRDALIFIGDVVENAGPDDAVTRSDENGVFVLADPPENLEFVSASHPKLTSASCRVEMERDKGASISIVLPAKGRVSGTVYFGGKPWPNQQVRCRSEVDHRHLEAVTDDAGVFSFENLPPGPAVVRVLAWLRFDERTRQRRWRGGRVEVGDARAAMIEFRYGAPTATVVGVVTRDGEPVQGHAILYAPATPDLEYRRTSLTADGVFEFPEVPDGPAWIRVENWKENFVRRVELEVEAGGITERDIELNDGSTVRGRISGLAPGDEARVHVLCGDLQFKGDALEVLKRHWSLLAGIGVVQGDCYRVDGLHAGHYTVLSMIKEKKEPGREERGTKPSAVHFFSVDGETDIEIDLDMERSSFTPA